MRGAGGGASGGGGGGKAMGVAAMTCAAFADAPSSKARSSSSCCCSALATAPFAAVAGPGGSSALPSLALAKGAWGDCFRAALGLEDFSEDFSAPLVAGWAEVAIAFLSSHSV